MLPYTFYDRDVPLIFKSKHLRLKRKNGTEFKTSYEIKKYILCFDNIVNKPRKMYHRKNFYEKF